MTDKTYEAWEHIRQMIIDLDKLWDADNTPAPEEEE